MGRGRTRWDELIHHKDTEAPKGAGGLLLRNGARSGSDAGWHTRTVIAARWMTKETRAAAA